MSMAGAINSLHYLDVYGSLQNEFLKQFWATFQVDTLNGAMSFNPKTFGQQIFGQKTMKSEWHYLK